MSHECIISKYQMKQKILLISQKILIVKKNFKIIFNQKLDQNFLIIHNIRIVKINILMFVFKQMFEV